MPRSPHAPRIATKGRSAEAIRRHYDTEKTLAARLRGASREDRPSLYRTVYDDLFRSVPDHPQLVRKHSPEEARRTISAQLRLLGPFLRRDAVFLELGAGDCALSLEIARRVEQVFAVDVSEQITAGVRKPDNLTVVICDGCTIPLPPNTVDLVYSNQLIEHVHPDDLVQQFRSVRSVLRQNGIYLCVTPNRLNGPHDISKYFDDEATGLHIKEYTNAELKALFLEAGFSDCCAYAGAEGRYLKLPVSLPVAIETILQRLPISIRKSIARRFPFTALLGIRMAARA
ncbi:MAG: class I SAM-dependent methyltransferase [Gammaproteobacteria bacterium]